MIDQFLKNSILNIFEQNPQNIVCDAAAIHFMACP